MPDHDTLVAIAVEKGIAIPRVSAQAIRLSVIDCSTTLEVVVVAAHDCDFSRAYRAEKIVAPGAKLSIL